MLDGIGAAAAMLAQPLAILYLLLGTVFGWALGVLPGLGSIQGMVLVIPFTYGMNPLLAMYLYAGMMGSTFLGGAVTSILIRIPGTGGNIATVFDGYAMAKQGQAARAIGLATSASFLGTILCLALMVILLAIVMRFLMAFGPPEMFMFVLWGLTSCVVISRGNIAKGLVSACLGLAFSFIGYSNVSGTARYTMGSTILSGGIDIAVFFIGIFGIAEVLNLATKRATISDAKITVTRFRDAIAGAAETFRHKACCLRSAGIGMVVGIIPGIGGAVANLLAYLVAQQSSPKPETFGKGNPEGVIAAETANNASQPGALLTTFAFGVPGSLETAVLIGIFMLHGFQPGPMFLKDNMAIVWAIIFGFVFSNIISGIGTLALAGRMANITRINVGLLIPPVAVISFMGVYAMRGQILDIFAAFIFGLLGYGMEKYGFSRVAICIGFVMGSLAETSFHASVMMAWGSWLIFFTRPISLVLFFLSVLTLSLPFLIPLLRRRLRSSR